MQGRKIGVYFICLVTEVGARCIVPSRAIKAGRIYSPPVAKLQKKGTIHCAPTKDTANIYLSVN